MAKQQHSHQPPHADPAGSRRVRATLVTLRAGTSGYAYRAWSPAFYPPKAKATELLARYAERLSTVEANSTFRKMPPAGTLAGWVKSVPPGFVFAVKAPQQITHYWRLRNCADFLTALFAGVDELGAHAGPILFQLAPQMKLDLGRLEGFLAELPDHRRYAFELRHPTWLVEEVYAALRKKGAALVWTDDPDHQTPEVTTADFGYIRLRKDKYSAASLRRWRDKIAAQPWQHAYAFVRHDETADAPKWALALGKPK